ncbi:MAG: sulfite exporter TauE/SafE family protein [Flavobacteriales bacterium]
MDFLVIFILLALLAEILGTVGGFGSSLLFVPIAGYFLDFHSVLGITAVFHVFSNISKIFFFRKGVKWGLVVYLGIPAVMFVVAGAILSNFVNSRDLELILSVVLIVISLVFLLYRKIKLRPTRTNSILSGVLSGFIAGLVGTGGAIRGLALSAFNLEKEIFIATSAIIDLGIDFSRGIVYYSNGFMHADDVYLIPILLGVSVVGTFIGKQLLNAISETQFRFIVLLLVLMVGLFTLYRQLFLV